MTSFHHIGYWVDDLDAVVDRAIRTLGIGPFAVHRHVAFESFTLADGTAITDPAYFDHTAAFAAWGPAVLELCDVHAIDPELAEAYGVRRGEQGPAVGHVSWVVEDLEAESARLEELGCALIQTASSGAVDVAWHRGGPPRAPPPAGDWDAPEPLRPIQPGPMQVQR